VREGVGLFGVLIGGSLPAVAGHVALAVVFLTLLAFGAWTIARRAPRPAPALRGAPASHPAQSGNAYLAFLLPLRHRSSRALLAVFALNATAPAITATVFQFFVADRLALPAAAPAFLALYFVAGAASMPVWVRLAQRASLHLVWLAGMVAAVLAFAWTWQLQPGQGTAFAAICVLSGLAFGADLALPPALLARVIDANGDGGRREGVYFGLWNFVNKLCLALAGGIALPLLQGLGYAQGATDPGALAALATVYAVVPCGLKLVAAGLLALAWRKAWF